MGDYLDVNLDLAAEANGEQFLLPISFHKSLTAADWKRLWKTGIFTPKQCAEIWRLHRHHGPPPKRMRILIRTKAVERHLEKILAKINS